LSAEESKAVVSCVTIWIVMKSCRGTNMYMLSVYSMRQCNDVVPYHVDAFIYRNCLVISVTGCLF